MHEAPFQFRQFTIKQDKCAMKVGTDGVLLGAWVQPRNSIKILDIGTGTGLIALMLAQKSTAHIDAIDIDGNAYEQAIENFRNSIWQNRVKAFHSSIQQFSKALVYKYDLIVSNPPFFEDAFKAGSEARNIARHTDETLNFDDLISCAKSLLQPEGRFCVILPYKEGNSFIEKAASSGLFIQRLTRVKTKIEKQEKRLLIELGFLQIPAIENDMVIQEEDLSFTNEYIDLTKDYYLWLKKQVV